MRAALGGTGTPVGGTRGRAVRAGRPVEPARAHAGRGLRAAAAPPPLAHAPVRSARHPAAQPSGPAPSASAMSPAPPLPPAPAGGSATTRPAPYSPAPTGAGPSPYPPGPTYRHPGLPAAVRRDGGRAADRAPYRGAGRPGGARRRHGGPAAVGAVARRRRGGRAGRGRRPGHADGPCTAGTWRRSGAGLAGRTARRPPPGRRTTARCPRRGWAPGSARAPATRRARARSPSTLTLHAGARGSVVGTQVSQVRNLVTGHEIGCTESLRLRSVLGSTLRFEAASSRPTAGGTGVCLPGRVYMVRRDAAADVLRLGPGAQAAGSPAVFTRSG